MSMFIKEVSDYYTLLSEQHVDVKHGSTNRAFCRFQDQEQFNQLRSNAAKNIVLVRNFSGRADGDYDEHLALNTIVLCFSSYAKNLTSAGIVTASEKAFEILLDFWVRMRQDFEEDNCVWLKRVLWEHIQFDEIEQPWLVNHYGWVLIIPYRTVLPAFNINKWGGVGIGPAPVPVRSMTRLMRFRVGDPGAPMVNADTDLYSALFEGKKLLVLVDGVALSVDEGTGDISWVGSIARHCEHLGESPTLLRFIGEVVHGEVVEIYELD